MAKQMLISMLTTCLMILTTTTHANPHHTSAAPIAKPSCLSRCGNVSIPFPFGIGAEKACFSDGWFEVVCNYSATPNRPFLKRLPDLEILEISTADDLIYTRNPVSFHNCPNKTSAPNPRLLNLTGSPFSFSESRNRLSAVGCNVFAYIDISSADDDSLRAAGCAPHCNNSTARSKYSSAASQKPRRSICQVTIPSYVSSYEIEFDDDLPYVNNSAVATSEETCSYAFVVDQKWFESRSNRVRDFGAAIREMDDVPVVLSWDFMLDRDVNAYYNAHNKTSNDMWRLKTFRCLQTEAASSVIGTRVSCRCNEGYRGNPYLRSCQDINECEETPKICQRFTDDDSMICVNTFGDFRCEHKIRQARQALIGIGSGVGALVLLFSGWGLYKFLKRREDIKRRHKFFKRNGGLLLQQHISSSDASVDQKTKLFNAKELEMATDHYNEDRILGHGGQGTVYKGMLGDGKIVAVKKSKLENNGRSVTDFVNEIVILSQINHRNVVKLLGCCLETEVPLLVYELIPNGILHHYIHDRDEEFQLTWEIRLRIAAEVAGALSYLHFGASTPVYHRDIKSSNILLDEKFRAKVADFGTSRSISEDQTHVTTQVAGTFGYVDPEYFRSSQFTEKSDVYSFGVVVIELLTGQKPVFRTSSNKGKSLVTQFIDCMEGNNLFDIIDPRIANEGCSNTEITITAVANLAYKCLNLIGKDRPTMKEVATELEAIQKSLVNKLISSETQQIFERTTSHADCMRRQVSERNWESASTSYGSTTLSFNTSM